jgi:8-oxo-dGTP pyrophosphatase MutT (NUDIX family)
MMETNINTEDESESSRQVTLSSYFKNIYCANCGEKGHVVRECGRPITSFGIIAFKVVNNASEESHDKNTYLTNLINTELNCKSDRSDKVYPKIKFLMIQRKDTMGYIDFIRGKYPNNEQEKRLKIKICLNEMTFKEKHNLLTQTFDEIWDNLWINHDSKCFKNEYENAKRKFNQFDIKSLVADSNTVYSFQELGFPKGRRNMRESNIICAEREFYEETGYNKSTYEFIKNYPTIQEEFVGTNGVKYRHTYYLVKMKSNVRPPKIDFTNKVQSGEVRNIGWFTYDESILLLRPYDTEKKRVLSDVYKDIVSMNYKFECSPYYSNSAIRRNEFDKQENNRHIYTITEEKYLNPNEYLIEGLYK